MLQLDAAELKAGCKEFSLIMIKSGLLPHDLTAEDLEGALAQIFPLPDGEKLSFDEAYKLYDDWRAEATEGQRSLSPMMTTILCWILEDMCPEASPPRVASQPREVLFMPN